MGGGSKNPKPSKRRTKELAFTTGRSNSIAVQKMIDAELMALPTPVDRKTLSMDLLRDAYVNSYVEFFYLTHRISDDGHILEPDLTTEQLVYIKDTLVEAENASRQGKLRGVHTAYQTIAEFFKKEKDYPSSVYFYEKCRDVLSLLDDPALKLLTYADLGATLELAKETEKAIENHEKHLEIAKAQTNEYEMIRASKSLVRSYNKFAEELRQNRTDDLAQKALENCIKNSTTANDLQGEAHANWMIGRIKVDQGRFKDAIAFFKQYLKLCLQKDDVEGEGKANYELGTAYRELDDIILALKYFEEYLRCAVIIEKPESTAQACAALGQIHARLGHTKKAIEYYSRQFELVRMSDNLVKVGAARVDLGVALGKDATENMLGLILKEEMDVLLKWKNQGELPEALKQKPAEAGEPKKEGDME